MRARSVVLLLLAAVTLPAAEWEDCRSGPFQVWTEEDHRDARLLLVRLEQVRHMVGTLLGKPDPVTLWPMYVLVPDSRQTARDWVLGRDAWLSVLPNKKAPSRQWQETVVRRLVEANAKRMPPHWEEGLIVFLSTLEAQGPKITLGTPPEPAARTKDWARVHFFATNVEYAARFRVMLNNIQQGADEEVAYRNSLGAAKAELENQIDAYFRAGQFAAVTVSGRAVSERDFPMRPIEPPVVAAALADSTGDARGVAAGSVEAAELAGLRAVEAGQKQQAADWLRQAVADGSKSPRVHLEYGRLLSEFKAQQDAFVQAAKLNPRWALPYIELANIEKTAARQAFYLKTAASLDGRNSDLWQRLGKAQLEAGEYTDASKSWFAAELAAPTAVQREVIRQARRDFEEERANREAAERRRVADERQRELDRLRTEALNRVREAEARANAKAPLDPGTKVEQWWDEKQPLAKITGVLQKVDCIGKQARLWIAAEGRKPAALWIPDSSQVVILGSGEASFGCGVQKPPRAVLVEFAPRPDARQGTAGDVRMIEFR